jgi:hypothetical protein
LGFLDDATLPWKIMGYESWDTEASYHRIFQ